MSKPLHPGKAAMNGLLAAMLAKGTPLAHAVREAKAYVAGAMQPGIPLGHGHLPLDHFWRFGKG